MPSENEPDATARGPRRRNRLCNRPRIPFSVQAVMPFCGNFSGKNIFSFIFSHIFAGCLLS
ncbi:hypothetical protein JCM10003_2671 [Bacteroides pyogenes JCM 10003]|nr:hypothetical protein JCM10003_2671 [Bacteroides pyogenes JCM 10003]